jgi:hypothetical protein
MWRGAALEGDGLRVARDVLRDGLGVVDLPAQLVEIDDLQVRAELDRAGGRASWPSRSLSSVVLPPPFGPMMPILSPRQMVVVKSRTIGAAAAIAKADVFASITFCPTCSPAWSFDAFTLPVALAALAPLGASACSARTRPGLRVRRAFTPCGSQASSCASFLSKAAHCFPPPRGSCLALEVGVVIAGPAHKAAAVEFDDAGGELAQEGAVVGDEEKGELGFKEKLLEPEDRLEIEMVGRLVEQQEVGLARPARGPAARGA